MNNRVIMDVECLVPLAKWLMYQSLPYDNPELKDVVDRIVEVVEKHELAEKSRSTVQGS